MTLSLPTLIPQPRHFAWSDGKFGFDASTVITLSEHASDATIYATRTLQTAIQNVSGPKLLLSKSASTANYSNAFQLILQDRDDQSSPRESSKDAVQDSQGYSFVITDGGVVVTARGEAGLFYAVQTLIQLIRTHGRLLPGCTCEDQPVLPHRGIMLDVSRGRVPTLATLLKLADTMAHYKLNQLQLYTEHTFQFATHPQIGVNCGSLSADDMLMLDVACRERHIDLVPNLQSTGHMRHILSLPEYEHLAETAWHWSITPARDETYRFLDELYADFLPAFSVPIFNVDSDEAWDHGRGQAQSLSAEVGYGRVYLDHILKLRELARKHGRQIMIWADVFHHYPDLIDEIPDDVILLDWQYEASTSYPTLEPLARSGRLFYVCPGTSSWNTIFPRIDNSLVNIRNYVRDGIAAGAVGMLLTDWGDMGHYQPLSNSWYSYLFGAEMAWTGTATATETYDLAFSRLFAGDASGQVVAAIRRLGRAVEHAAFAFPNRSDIVYALYDEPLAGRMISTTPPEALAEMIEAAATATHAFALLPDPTLRHELLFTVSQLTYAARKVEVGQKIRATLRELAGSTGSRIDGTTRLDACIADMQRLRTALPPMVAEFEQIWLQSSGRSEISINLDRYAALVARFDAALDWLRQQRAVYVAGAALDGELMTYKRGEYRVLREEHQRDLQRLVDIVGRDAVPPEILRWLGLTEVA